MQFLYKLACLFCLPLSSLRATSLLTGDEYQVDFTASTTKELQGHFGAQIPLVKSFRSFNLSLLTQLSGHLLNKQPIRLTGGLVTSRSLGEHSVIGLNALFNHHRAQLNSWQFGFGAGCDRLAVHAMTRFFMFTPTDLPKRNFFDYGLTGSYVIPKGLSVRLQAQFSGQALRLLRSEESKKSRYSFNLGYHLHQNALVQASVATSSFSSVDAQLGISFRFSGLQQTTVQPSMSLERIFLSSINTLVDPDTESLITQLSQKENTAKLQESELNILETLIPESASTKEDLSLKNRLKNNKNPIVKRLFAIEKAVENCVQSERVEKNVSKKEDNGAKHIVVKSTRGDDQGSEYIATNPAREDSQGLKNITLFHHMKKQSPSENSKYLGKCLRDLAVDIETGSIENLRDVLELLCISVRKNLVHTIPQLSKCVSEEDIRSFLNDLSAQALSHPKEARAVLKDVGEAMRNLSYAVEETDFTSLQNALKPLECVLLPNSLEEKNVREVVTVLIDAVDPIADFIWWVDGDRYDRIEFYQHILRQIDDLSSSEKTALMHWRPSHGKLNSTVSLKDEWLSKEIEAIYQELRELGKIIHPILHTVLTASNLGEALYNGIRQLPACLQGLVELHRDELMAVLLPRKERDGHNPSQNQLRWALIDPISNFLEECF